MKSLRLALLLAVAVILPSCGRHWNDRVHLTVTNQGSVSAEVRAEAEYWSGFDWEDHVDFTVHPQESAEAHFNFRDLSRLKVRIYRSSDHLKIFDDFWDRSDLEDLDERVVITISP